jgi:aspartyl-tRNA(Asn)/glutamyl-tRNA(Gln) amidotransferase subunit A
VTSSTSTTTIARQVNAGLLRAPDVTEAALDRAEAAQSRLNAFTVIDRPRALAAAEAVQARIAAREHLPLAGVPLIVKDNIFVEGWRITQGSRLFADHVAPRDALAVQRARAAGAIVIAIGACSEFACKGVTATPLHGVTHHPLDPALTPGGSSGGNAAAVAAGVAPLALGTDAGGSSRRPPAHCGIVGFKPSQGAIAHPFGFPEPFWGISCISPMAGNVADAIALFDAIVGPDPLDPESHFISVQREPARLRIAASPVLGLNAPADADMLDAFAAALGALAARMQHVFTHAAPHWPGAEERALLGNLQHAGLAAIHGAAWRRDPSDIDPDVGAQIGRGFSLDGPSVAAALEASQNVRRAAAAFFADHDLMLSLTTPCAAWPHHQLGPAMIGGQAVDPRGHAVLTPLWNHAHCPAISLPCGRDRSGLPVGLQIAGRAGADRDVLSFALAAEAALAEAGLWSTP